MMLKIETIMYNFNKIILIYLEKANYYTNFHLNNLYNKCALQ
jgi:hypothetical protein